MPSTNKGSADRRRIREKLSEAQNHRCCYCGADVRVGATFEHVVSKWAGGVDAQSNLVIACETCNVRRGGYQNAYAFFKRVRRERENA